MTSSASLFEGRVTGPAGTPARCATRIRRSRRSRSGGDGQGPPCTRSARHGPRRTRTRGPRDPEVGSSTACDSGLLPFSGRVVQRGLALFAAASSPTSVASGAGPFSGRLPRLHVCLHSSPYHASPSELSLRGAAKGGSPAACSRRQAAPDRPSQARSASRRSRVTSIAIGAATQMLKH